MEQAQSHPGLREFLLQWDSFLSQWSLVFPHPLTLPSGFSENSFLDGLGGWQRRYILLSVSQCPSLFQSSKCFAVSRVFLRSIPGQHRIRTLLSYCRRLLYDRSAAALVPGRTNFLSTLPTTCQGVGAGHHLDWSSYLTRYQNPRTLPSFWTLPGKWKGIFFKVFVSQA